MKREICFLEVKSGLCAPCARGKLGAELGIDAIKNAAIANDSFLFLEKQCCPVVGVNDHWEYAQKNLETYKKDLYYNTINDRYARHINYLIDTYKKISDNVATVLGENKFPFILAGDHSNAAGSIAGIKKFYPNKRLGVVRIDAHADIHSPYTTPSGNMHGMPVACALNLGQDDAVEIYNELEKKGERGKINVISESDTIARKELCSSAGVNPMIQKEDIVFIGIRDLEQEESTYIQKYIKYFDGEYIQKKGIDGIIPETLEYLNKCDIIYVSFDIDSIDGRIVHGTGTPVKDGLTQHQAEQLLQELYNSDKIVAMEVVEINPLLDDDIGNTIDTQGKEKTSSFETRNGTAEIAFQIIKKILSA